MDLVTPNLDDVDVARKWPIEREVQRFLGEEINRELDRYGRGVVDEEEILDPIMALFVRPRECKRQLGHPRGIVRLEMTDLGAG